MTEIGACVVSHHEEKLENGKRASVAGCLGKFVLYCQDLHLNMSTSLVWSSASAEEGLGLQQAGPAAASWPMGRQGLEGCQQPLSTILRRLNSPLFLFSAV